MKVVSRDLKHMGADEAAVAKTISKATSGLREKALEKNRQARTDYRSRKIMRVEYTAIRLQSATEQTEGIVDAITHYRDQLNQSLATKQAEKEVSKAVLKDNVSANVSDDGEATGKVEDDVADEKTEKSNSGQGNGSFFGQLKQLSAKIDKLEKIFQAAFASNAKLSASKGVIEGSIDSMLIKEMGKGRTSSAFSFGGLRCSGFSGGVAVHTRGDSDGTRAGFVIGGAGGIGMGSMGRRTQGPGNDLGSQPVRRDPQRCSVGLQAQRSGVTWFTKG
jgi:hypothetical protein